MGHRRRMNGPTAQHSVSEIAVITFNDIPRINPTFKYERLGPMAIENHRQYCQLQGYPFIHEVVIDPVRPACWSKIPAILAALNEHRWVLWADADTLVANPVVRLEKFCDERFDMIVQSMDAYFIHLGIEPDVGGKEMPLNTGVFFMQATDWSKDFLRRTYEQNHFVSAGEIWDGIGEQEAMISLLRSRPEDQARIGYTNGLQTHPAFRTPADLFVHFYGNHASHLIAADECNRVLRRWEEAIARQQPLPDDFVRFHWCCIQNKSVGERIDRGGPERFLYNRLDIMEGR
jgi:hypothetical protein